MKNLSQPKNPRILIVDDEADTLDIFSRHLSKDYQVDTVQSAFLALEKIKSNNYHIALIDLVMPGEDGLELLRSIKENCPQISVIVISGKASIEMAVKAMQLGAEEFIEKPVEDLDIIKIKIRNIMKSKWQSEEIERLRSILDSGFDRTHIVGSSLAIQQIMEKVKKIAPLDTTVFITGETGVGKELFAELIYRNSSRRHQKFVVVNCGSIPETLLESMLFGHTKGAFTGAIKDKEGYFAEADGGTLFLDEITETSAAFQIKLLRALEKGTIRKVGGEKDEFVDVRIIAATNRNILDEVNNGHFREDLFYRLNVIGINIPPLRERIEDIKLLANDFVHNFGERYKKPNLSISEPVMTLLLSKEWKGNVRELKNVMEHAVALCMHKSIVLEDLPQHIFQTNSQTFYKRKYDNLPYAKAKDYFEKEYVERLLKMFDGDVTKTANFSQIKRPNLYDKFRKYDIDPNDFRKS
ncbi:MAG TPA: sigma-54 dependent transcriptional regulator [Candidatus Cloacimonadota bacterium]|nr:sigma-54 dependent transcriptional regulator [Candidatus Cloacimonadota bacterium]